MRIIGTITKVGELKEGVAKDSGISSVHDLEGKKIATPGEASIQHMLLTYYLEQNGMSIDDLKVSAMKSKRSMKSTMILYIRGKRNDRYTYGDI